MIRQETHEVERKMTAILEILSDSSDTLGGRIISRRLEERGIALSERAVRYRLKIMDERGLTRSVGNRDGREITQTRLEELRSSLVYDKVGFATGRIELLAYLTSFVSEVARRGEGKSLASFHEITMISRPESETILERLKAIDLCNLFVIGKTTEPICEIPVNSNKVGVILFSRLNSAASAVEKIYQ